MTATHQSGLLHEFMSFVVALSGGRSVVIAMNEKARSVVAHTIASYVAAAVIIYHLFPLVPIPPGPAPLVVKILVTAVCCALAPVLIPPFLIVATVACVANPHYRTVWLSVDWVTYLGVLFVATEMLKAAYRRQ